MTLQEAKNKIANKYNYLTFGLMEQSGYAVSTMELLMRHDEAAELYARSKWESGLDAAIKKFEEAKSKAETLRDVVYLDGVLTILDLTKPEFKP